MGDFADLFLGFAFMAGVSGYFILQPWTPMRAAAGALPR